MTNNWTELSGSERSKSRQSPSCRTTFAPAEKAFCIKRFFDIGGTIQHQICFRSSAVLAHALKGADEKAARAARGIEQVQGTGGFVAGGEGLRIRDGIKLPSDGLPEQVENNELTTSDLRGKQRPVTV